MRKVARHIHFDGQILCLHAEINQRKNIYTGDDETKETEYRTPHDPMLFRIFLCLQMRTKFLSQIKFQYTLPHWSAVQNSNDEFSFEWTQ